MHRVCGILDLNGFILHGHDRRRPTEIGFAPVKTLTRSCRVSIDLYKVIPEFGWSAKDQQTINFCFHRLHGLPDQLTYQELRLSPFVDVSEVGDQIPEWYNEYLYNVRDVVAYKGGSLERQLLEELQIPSVNLEECGCPKLEFITSDNYLCPFHRKNAQIFIAQGLQCVCFVTVCPKNYRKS